MSVRDLVPLGVRAQYRRRQLALRHSRALSRGISALKRNPEPPDSVWDDLAFGWGGWAASADLLRATSEAACSTTAPVLECGSGLTTLVLAAISRHTASDLWSLEHDPHWHEVTNHALQRFGLRANLRLARLRSYGDFDWYDIDPSAVPDFSVVVCDGPPNSTRGGRYGLFPVLRDRLTADCVILLDDAERPSERELVRRWSQEESWAYEIRGEDRRFAVIVPAGAVPPEQNATSREPVTVRGRSVQRLALVVACIAVMLAGFVALPEVLGDRPYDPCPSCAVQEVHR